MRLKFWLITSGVLLTIIVALAVWAWIAIAPYRNLDILITGGTVVDGEGSPPRVCDIAIRDGKIVAVGGWQLMFASANLTIDATGKIVAPGFIDVHTHVEPNINPGEAFQPANFLRQGVTTIITGNCGRSRVDTGKLFSELENNGTRVNLATLVGHNSIRREVMQTSAQAPTREQLKRMEQLVEQAMKNGAIGLSTGLAYVPGRFAQLGEIVALARIAARYGGLYVSHIRDEGRRGMEAIREALEIGRLSVAHTHISHFKSSGRSQWSTTLERLRLLEQARAEGRHVTIDVYPYDRSSTTTDVLLPDWAVKDNRAGLRQAAKDVIIKEQLRADIKSELSRDGWSDLSHVTLVAGRTEWVGKTLAEAPAQAAGLDAQVDNLIEISMRGGAQAIYADMNEASIQMVMLDPYSVFGSDSAVRDPDAPYKPHPRGCGTFPRVFRRYVREMNLIDLSIAVHKASAQAAEIFGLENRGRIREGNWGDIVIFDSEQIEDRADYDQPFAEPQGIDYVIINGVVAVDHGNLTSEKPSGQVLRRKRTAIELLEESQSPPSAKAVD